MSSSTTSTTANAPPPPAPVTTTTNETESSHVHELDPFIRERLTSLFSIFQRHIFIEINAHISGEDGTLFSNWASARGSRLTVILKLDRPNTLYYDTEHDKAPRYFDFAAVNNVVKQLKLVPRGEQLHFDLQLVDDQGNFVHVDQMGNVNKRPQHLMSDERGVPLPKVTAAVQQKRQGQQRTTTSESSSSLNHLDSVVFPRVLITTGVSSRFLHTESTKFAFRAVASNISLDRWKVCFPHLELPNVQSNSFFVCTSRASQMAKARSNQKRKRNAQ